MSKKEAKKQKKDTIHPNYRPITVKMTDGSTFVTRSTYQHDTLTLDIDVKTHVAWTGTAGFINSRASQVSKFNERYSGLNFTGKKQ